MKPTLKIAFFGTSDRSTPILEELNKSFDLKLCVTKTDRKVGRKQVVQETKVKEWAKNHGINLIEIDSLKGTNKELVIQALQDNEIEIGIVADFSFMIPIEIIEKPKLKLVNVHFSLLPKYRGACPVQYAILKGESVTGISYFVMDQGMDTGKILKTITYEISPEATSQNLFDSLFELAAANIADVINEYNLGKLVPYSQNEAVASYTYSKTQPNKTYIFKEDAQIDWKESTNDIFNAIRAFYPWPVSWTYLGEIANLGIKIKSDKNKKLRVKIISAQMVNGKIIPTALQVEGAKVSNWQDFLNGYTEN